jgi:hypothetical protein
MYRRSRVHIEVPRQESAWVCRVIKIAWIIGVLTALCLAINILKEAI